MSHNVRIEDIAKECGVTKGLVSRALAGKYNVGDETRSLIMTKAVQLGYDFSHLWSRKKRNKVVLIMSKHILQKEEFWQPITSNIYSTLERHNIGLEYYIFEDGNIDKKTFKTFDDPLIGGYIIIHINPSEIVDYLKTKNKPIIEVDPKQFHLDGITQFQYSNYVSMYRATMRLIELGHKKIAFYGSDKHATSFRERHEGFLACIDTMKSEGIDGFSIDFDNSNLFYADNKALRETIKANKFTALICANDLIALNAYKTIKSMGLSIPNDISVIGFDNVNESKTCFPKLSTFNISRDRMGKEIASYIVGVIQDKNFQFSQVTIQCDYIERDSVREIRK